ncbi:MAG: type II toxin-antitoxin system MqsA family antitoxin [Alphaproteobacteria bacterium]|nr:type II toxin-antitoxin system MqsA family antitoxin [Alphaproteobacteria bacterium]
MKTKTCGSCGADQLVPFSNEAFEVTHGGQTVHVAGLSGKRCSACGEVHFDARSTKKYAATGDKLVLAEREAMSAEIRRIRKRLGLSQAKAAHITGGGHNAFSRYERGEAMPMPAVVNLFRLLDKHPDLLKEIA